MKVNDFLIEKEASIKEAIEKINAVTEKLLAVVDNHRLIGTVTDGDIRKWILSGRDMKLPVSHIMNRAPIFLKEEERDKALEAFRIHEVPGIPVINSAHEVTDIIFWKEAMKIPFHKIGKLPVPVVIMAGGKGRRLHPYTKIFPKPLIPIGDVPIMERIINKFMDYGFHKFYVTINYKKELLKAYFSGERPYELQFFEESSPLGTAGSLSLITEHAEDDFFVSNCDILLDIDYKKLLDYHLENKHKITVVTAIKNYEIPYGVVTLKEKGKLEGIIEKPKYELLVNTGLYVINKEILKYVEEGKYLDMPDLIKVSIENGESVGAYPVMESAWLDMGELPAMEDMEERLGYV